MKIRCSASVRDEDPTQTSLRRRSRRPSLVQRRKISIGARASVGPTTVYGFMQVMGGLISDCVEGWAFRSRAGGENCVQCSAATKGS